MTVYFEVICKMGKRIRITQEYWHFLVSEKHPSIAHYEKEIEVALITPDQIRRSKKDSAVHLYYKKLDRHWLCVVGRHLNGDGFIITAYLTGKIKEGEKIWPR